jgi:DNA polymerase-1
MTSTIKFVGNPRLLDCCERTTIEDVVDYCSNVDYLAVDTETTGLNHIEDRMIMLQIGDHLTQFVIDTRYIDISPLRNILESSDIVKILHNVKFDYKFLLQYNIRLNNVWDTMLTSQVIHCGKDISHSLANVLSRELNIEMDKSVRANFISKGSAEFTESEIVYGAKDIEYLIHLFHNQSDACERLDLRATAMLENEAALAYGDIEYNGIGLDKDNWLKLAKKAANDVRLISITLDAFIESNPKLNNFVNDYIQGDLFIEVESLRKVNVKWSSPKQVLNVFKTYGLDVEDVNAKNLHVHSKDPFVKTYIKYKEQAKLATSYGEKFLENLDSDGRIRTSFKQILNTGRVASGKPNMQQIPADNDYRNCFISGYDDWVFVSCDYSSQELCIIATGSKDPVWLKALEDGEDLHSVCADLVYGKEWQNAAEDDCAYMQSKAKCNCPKHKKLRTNVKSINFGLAYGMGPHKLADTLLITNKEAERLIEKYFKAFPAIKNFLVSLGNYGKQNGHIKTYAPYRRIRWFQEWNGINTNEAVMGKIERASKNTPIQGSGADMCKSALVIVREHIYINDLPVKLVMTVHDQIDTIVHKDYADTWKDTLQDIMELSTLDIIPSGLLKAESEISTVWKK